MKDVLGSSTRYLRPLLLVILVCFALTHCVVGGGETPCKTSRDCPAAAPHCTGQICMVCRQDSDCPPGKRCSFVGARSQCLADNVKPPILPDRVAPSERRAAPDLTTNDTARVDATGNDDASAKDAPQEAPLTREDPPEPPSSTDALEPAPESVDDEGGAVCKKGDSRDCYNGPKGTEGIGECKAGTSPCINGVWGPCVDAVVPKTEKCDGADNDCDGKTDEDCDCIPGRSQECYSGAPNTSGVGPCKKGTQWCEQTGQWGKCTGQVLPAREVCDGKDNDCDGKVDENNPGGGAKCSTTKPGECKAGTIKCFLGKLGCAANKKATQESCDGKDNDCDGSVDENNPGGGAKCSTTKPGECKAGTIKCFLGKLGCAANKKASKEVCDGKDNDCDGSIDENNAGGGASCSTPKPGVCKAGTMRCVSGKLSCFANKKASAETCDGKDNDCDGQTDEGIASKTCYTFKSGNPYCFPGTTKCTGGKTTCAPASAARQCTSNASCTVCGAGSVCRSIIGTLKLCAR